LLPARTVILEKVVVAQLVEKLSVFYGRGIAVAAVI
jgi:hypothetical protein